MLNGGGGVRRDTGIQIFCRPCLMILLSSWLHSSSTWSLRSRMTCCTGRKEASWWTTTAGRSPVSSGAFRDSHVCGGGWRENKNCWWTTSTPVPQPLPHPLVSSPLPPAGSGCGPRTEPCPSSRHPSSAVPGFQPPGCRPPPPPGPSSQRWPAPSAPPPAPAAAPSSAAAPVAPCHRPAAPGPPSAARKRGAGGRLRVRGRLPGVKGHVLDLFPG